MKAKDARAKAQALLDRVEDQRTYPPEDELQEVLDLLYALPKSRATDALLDRLETLAE